MNYIYGGNIPRDLKAKFYNTSNIEVIDQCNNFVWLITGMKYEMDAAIINNLQINKLFIIITMNDIDNEAQISIERDIKQKMGKHNLSNNTLFVKNDLYSWDLICDIINNNLHNNLKIKKFENTLSFDFNMFAAVMILLLLIICILNIFIYFSNSKTSEDILIIQNGIKEIKNKIIELENKVEFILINDALTNETINYNMNIIKNLNENIDQITNDIISYKNIIKENTIKINELYNHLIDNKKQIKDNKHKYYKKNHLFNKKAYVIKY